MTNGTDIEHPRFARMYLKYSPRMEQRGASEHVLSYRPAEATAPPVFPPEWLAELYSPAQAVFSAEKAGRVLGWRPRVSLEEGLERTIAWLRDSGRLPTGAD